MNIIGWIHSHLDYRCLFGKCFLNIDGETEDVKVSLDRDGHWNTVKIKRERKPDLEVYLGNMDPLTASLYYFRQDSGFGATLFIPALAEDDEDLED